MEESSIKSKTISGVKWSAVESFLTQGIQFLIGLVLARLLAPSDFGVVGMLAIFIAISQSLVDSGFSNALIRKVDRSEQDFYTAFYFNIAVGVAMYLLLCLFAPLIATFFNVPILERLIYVLSLCVLFDSFCVVQRARLAIVVDFKTQAKATLISVVLSGVVGIFLALNNCGIWSLVCQQVLRSVINTFLLWIFARWLPKLVFSWSSFRSLFSFGSKIMIAGLISTIYQHLSTVAIGKFYTPTDLGFYSRGQQFAMLPSVNLNTVIQRVTFPILSKIQNDNQRLIDTYRHYICSSSLLIFFCMVFLASIGRPLVLVLLGAKWAEAIIYLQIFCFAYMFDHICSINLNLLYVKGRSDLVLKLEVIKKSIAFVILLISIKYGVIWICASTILYTQIAVLINTYYTGKLFHLGYIQQIRDFGPFFILSLIVCAPFYILGESNFHPLLVLVVSCILAPLLFMLILRRNPYMNEIVGIIRNQLKL